MTSRDVQRANEALDKVQRTLEPAVGSLFDLLEEGLGKILCLSLDFVEKKKSQKEEEEEMSSENKEDIWK